MYEVPRTVGEEVINDYNAAVMLLWRGNMDIQFIGEKSRVLNYYMTKYISKSEREDLKSMFASVNAVYKKRYSRLKSFANKCLQVTAFTCLLLIYMFTFSLR